MVFTKVVHFLQIKEFKMRVVFMGTPDYATTILKKMINSDLHVPLVITQPDKPVGRKQILTPPHVKKWIIENEKAIKIYQPKTLRKKEVEEIISSYNPDYIVVAAFGQILPKNILDIAPCINLHASLLPKYRGASPIQTSILNNDVFTGVTAMLMEEGLDSGDILGFRFVKILDKRVDLLFDELSHAAANLTINVLENFKQIQQIQQLDADASYCVKIKKDNGLFSFNESSNEIFTKYRAYTPWPGIFLKNRLKIKEMRHVKNSDMHEKTGIISEIGKDFISVTCRAGFIEILKVQAPSKKEISVIDYIRGKRLGVGSQLV